MFTRVNKSLVFQALRNKSSKSKSMFPAKAHVEKEIFFPGNRDNGIRNRIALVTGGTDGIGLRCAKELLKNHAKGVMIADTNQTRGFKTVLDLAQDFGKSKIAFIQIHPGSYTLLKNAFTSTINFYKGLDIVINNIRYRETNWEDQVDENIKGIVLSTQLCLEFMGRNNGGHGGVLVNVSSDHSDACPLHNAVQDFVVRFDKSVACTYYDSSNVKVLTLCRATFDMIECDLSTILTKGINGCVWK